MNGEVYVAASLTILCEFLIVSLTLYLSLLISLRDYHFISIFLLFNTLYETTLMVKISFFNRELM